MQKSHFRGGKPAMAFLSVSSSRPPAGAIPSHDDFDGETNGKMMFFFTFLIIGKYIIRIG